MIHRLLGVTAWERCPEQCGDATSTSGCVHRGFVNRVRPGVSSVGCLPEAREGDQSLYQSESRGGWQVVLSVSAEGKRLGKEGHLEFQKQACGLWYSACAQKLCETKTGKNAASSRPVTLAHRAAGVRAVAAWPGRAGREAACDLAGGGWRAPRHPHTPAALPAVGSCCGPGRGRWHAQPSLQRRGTLFRRASVALLTGVSGQSPLWR